MYIILSVNYKKLRWYDKYGNNMKALYTNFVQDPSIPTAVSDGNSFFEQY